MKSSASKLARGVSGYSLRPHALVTVLPNAHALLWAGDAPSKSTKANCRPAVASTDSTLPARCGSWTSYGTRALVAARPRYITRPTVYTSAHPVVAEYALRGVASPVDVAEYRVTDATEALPAELREALPSLEAARAELEAAPLDEESPNAGDVRPGA